MSKKEILDDLAGVANRLVSIPKVDLEDEASNLWSIIQFIDVRYDLVPKKDIENYDYNDTEEVEICLG